jgi:RimJ/RimL family protein N-acetyltransferase
MRLEGHLRENEFYRNRWWDTLMYAILADEWQMHKQSHAIQWNLVEE